MCVQQGSFGSARDKIKENLKLNKYESQHEIIKMCVLERAKTAS